jgi:DnaJ-class molecular chaperone
LCRVVVETPVNLSKAQIKIFEEFAKSTAGDEHHPIKQSFNKASDQFHNK